MNKKGAAFVWIVSIIAIFAFAWMFITINQGYEKMSATLGANLTGTPFEPTYNKINTIWIWYPVLFFLFMIGWGISTTMRKKNQYG